MADTNYTLSFSSHIIRLRDDKTKIHNRWTLKARKELEDVKGCAWKEWLECTMKDAVYIQTKRRPDQVPIEEISLTLNPHREKGMFCVDAHTYITGIVSWKSISIGNTFIQGAIDWRLGQMFSHYNGIGNKKKWALLFHPGMFSYTKPSLKPLDDQSLSVDQPPLQQQPLCDHSEKES